MAVFPANFYLYQDQEILPAPPLVHVLRLPLQGLLILLACETHGRKVIGMNLKLVVDANSVILNISTFSSICRSFLVWNENMDLQELEAIAERELRKHGLMHWSFGLARTKRRQGVCKFRNRRIEIAEYYARHNSPEKVLDTLLHEIAHALAGPKAGHGPGWKAIAQKLGATPQACDTCADTVVMPGDWQATCEACCKTYHKYKRPQQLNGYRCRCVARKPLMFQFTGNPSRQPSVPEPIERSAKWEAKCGGCQTVHLRIRKPKAGVWRCRCPHRCEIVWGFRTSGDAQ